MATNSLSRVMWMRPGKPSLRSAQPSGKSREAANTDRAA